MPIYNDHTAQDKEYCEECDKEIKKGEKYILETNGTWPDNFIQSVICVECYRNIMAGADEN